MELDYLKAFHHVASEGSIKAAEPGLGIKSSFISKQLKSLEQQLGVKLFSRHRRGLMLTEAGRNLYTHTLKIFAAVEEIDRDFTRGSIDQKRSVKILTTTGAASHAAVAYLKEFTNQYPEIKIYLNCIKSPVSLRDHPADFAFLPEPCRDMNIIDEKLMTQRWYCYASKSYLNKFGEPHSAGDLCNHRLIAFRHEHGTRVKDSDMHIDLALRHNQDFVPTIYINSFTAFFEAGVAGLGIIILPEHWPQIELLGLKKLLPKNTFESSLYLSYLESMQGSQMLQLLKKTIGNNNEKI